MIPMDYITAWKSQAPWATMDLIEQDLVISRALVDLYTSNLLQEKIAFRGGTALNKLFFPTPARFSEDIDLVQFSSEPIGVTIDEIRARLSWLGEPRRKQNEGRVTLTYRFETEATQTQVKLKVEINTREHLSKFALVKKKLEVKNPWFTGTAEITSYLVEELLGTKVRALYQRRKGRDLFDLWLINEEIEVDWAKVAVCFRFYLAEEGTKISKNELFQNLDQKMLNREFLADMSAIKRSEIEYDPNQAMKFFQQVVSKYF